MPTGQLFLSWLFCRSFGDLIPWLSHSLPCSCPRLIPPSCTPSSAPCSFFWGLLLCCQAFLTSRDRQLFPATFPASTWFLGDVWVSVPNCSSPGLTRPWTPLGQLQSTPDFRHLQVRCSYGCHGFQKPTDTQQPPG